MSNIIRTKKLLQTDICIIGGGSVGLTLGTMLRKYNLNYLIFEKEKSLSNHPKAHYISPKTVEIYKYFNLSAKLNKYNEISNAKYYRYCSHLLNIHNYYGEINHFKTYEENLNEALSVYPMHIGQDRLNKVLLDNTPEEAMLMGYEFIGFDKVDSDYKM
jgi:2-polyprenyl-6-methoxyphenol hydroxylase-like FAD-dependent oxidoreductase